MFQKIAKHRANDASNDVHRPPLVPAHISSIDPSEKRYKIVNPERGLVKHLWPKLSFLRIQTV